MTSPGFIRPVGDECQLSPLNYSDTVLHSLTRRFARDEENSGLSIKYVVSGVERYRIGHQWHSIQDNKFLVVNAGQQFQCRVEAKSDVEGLCLYLDPRTVADIAQNWRSGHEGMLEKDLSELPQTPAFTEKIYALEENKLGTFLKATVPTLRCSKARQEMDSEAFFRGLAEALLSAQGETDRLLGRLDHERKATKEEILRRVSLAKQYIDEHYLEEINLDEVAAAAHFSKYHFLRCFKQVYGIAPYQYILTKRLDTAKQFLAGSRRSLSDIAIETGFGDRRAFNKAFRKAYGCNPAEIRS